MQPKTRQTVRSLKLAKMTLLEDVTLDEKTFAKVSTHYYCKGIKQDVNDWVN